MNKSELKWFEHVKRMNESMVKKVSVVEVGGSRGKGEQQRRLDDQWEKFIDRKIDTSERGEEAGEG